MGLNIINNNINKNNRFSFNIAKMKKPITTPKYAEREKVLKRANESIVANKIKGILPLEPGVLIIIAKRIARKKP